MTSPVPLWVLTARARQVRDAGHGTRVTFSPAVLIPPGLPPEEVLERARAGAEAGCHEARFTLGEAPEER